MGTRSFIFSGYPHIDECQSFGERVLSSLKTCSLPVSLPTRTNGATRCAPGSRSANLMLCVNYPHLQMSVNNSLKHTNIKQIDETWFELYTLARGEEVP